MRRWLIVPCALAVLAWKGTACAQNPNESLNASGGMTHASASTYQVDGLALGSKVVPGTPTYREYQCGPSQLFPRFTWCNKQKQERQHSGTVDFSNSILHTDDGTAVYINKNIEPASFGPGEVDREISRLSAKYGRQANVLRMTRHSGLDRDAVIATWGQIKLEVLGADTLAALASGKEVNAGLRVDYIGDFQKSARLGLPVYRIAGGEGYLWSASYDSKGRGHVRVLTSNASAYDLNRDRSVVAENPMTPSTTKSTNSTPSSQPRAEQGGEFLLQKLRDQYRSDQTELNELLSFVDQSSEMERLREAQAQYRGAFESDDSAGMMKAHELVSSEIVKARSRKEQLIEGKQKGDSIALYQADQKNLDDGTTNTNRGTGVVSAEAVDQGNKGVISFETLALFLICCAMLLGGRYIMVGLWSDQQGVR